jgi:hypothetical protein
MSRRLQPPAAARNRPELLISYKAPRRHPRRGGSAGRQSTIRDALHWERVSRFEHNLQPSAGAQPARWEPHAYWQDRDFYSNWKMDRVQEDRRSIGSGPADLLTQTSKREPNSTESRTVSVRAFGHLAPPANWEHFETYLQPKPTAARTSGGTPAKSFERAPQSGRSRRFPSTPERGFGSAIHATVRPADWDHAAFPSNPTPHNARFQSKRRPSSIEHKCPTILRCPIGGSHNYDQPNRSDFG